MRAHGHCLALRRKTLRRIFRQLQAEPRPVGNGNEPILRCGEPGDDLAAAEGVESVELDRILRILLDREIWDGSIEMQT